MEEHITTTRRERRPAHFQQGPAAAGDGAGGPDRPAADPGACGRAAAQCCCPGDAHLPGVPVQPNFAGQCMAANIKQLDTLLALYRLDRQALESVMLEHAVHTGTEGPVARTPRP